MRVSPAAVAVAALSFAVACSGGGSSSTRRKDLSGEDPGAEDLSTGGVKDGGTHVDLTKPHDFATQPPGDDPIDPYLGTWLSTSGAYVVSSCGSSDTTIPLGTGLTLLIEKTSAETATITASNPFATCILDGTVGSSTLVNSTTQTCNLGFGDVLIEAAILDPDSTAVVSGLLTVDGTDSGSCVHHIEASVEKQ